MKVFISFDYEKDKEYKYLLDAMVANKRFDISFNDVSAEEINSNRVDRVKAVLTQKINQADVTIVIVGKDANRLHKDAYLIGYRNWQNFEVARSIDAGNKIIAVKIKSSYGLPEKLYGNYDVLVHSYTVCAIENALSRV